MSDQTRRDFLRLSSLGMLSAGLGALGSWRLASAADADPMGVPRAAAAGSRPNIIVVLADDFGYGDAHFLDPQYSKIPTPHMDRLAQQGMAFTDAHSPSAVCTPTRYGMLTGRYAWRTRLQRGVLRPWDPPLISPGRPTLPGLLNEQGYHTAAIGKWHLGMGWPRQDKAVDFDRPITGGPTTHGFDHYFGIDVPNQPPYTFINDDRVTQQPTDHFDVAGKDKERAAEMFVRQSGPMVQGWRFDQVLPTLTEKAVGYIDQRAKEQAPFFLYFALTTPHEPVAPSERFKGKSGISGVGDLIMETDWALGEIMAALEKNGLAQNTLLIFTGDNGHCHYTEPEHFQRAGHRVSGPYRGMKADIWEGGHREPFVARWPGVIQAGARCDQTICLTDLFATCAALVGAALPKTGAEDSVSFLPLFKGADTAVRQTMVVHSTRGEFAIRDGNWLLALCPEPTPPGAARDNQPPGQLYDLAADPSQTTNLYVKHPEIVARLLAALEKIVADGRSTPGPAGKNDVAIDLWKAPRAAAPPKGD
ncbi:MAG: arylsulfatase [Phycisphaeraceae bacterium]